MAQLPTLPGRSPAESRNSGSDSGGERAATMYTIIETAKLNGLDPEAYLRAHNNTLTDGRARHI